LTRVIEPCQEEKDLYKKMKRNLGLSDRIIRIAFAAVLVTAYLTHLFAGGAALFVLVVGLALGLSSIAGRCPLYKLLGISTLKKSQTDN
jgi:hypothetical protein